MEVKGTFSKDYWQRYRVVYDSAGRVVAKNTDWYQVSSAYFRQRENNIGTEVAAKNHETGAVKRVVGPPGYTNYIGNNEYGYWSDGKPKVIYYKEVMPQEWVDSFGEPPYLPDTLITGADQAISFNYQRIDRSLLPDDAPIAEQIKTTTSSANLQMPIAADYWMFYPQYQYVKNLLQLPTGKIKYSEHQEARRYYARSYPYYGIIIYNGTRRYGTYGSASNLYRSTKRYSRGGGGYGK